MIFRKAKNGELKQDSGLQQLCDTVNVFEIDVSETGVKGAKSFFEAQVILNIFKVYFCFK
jgi:hypothetical protein